MYSGDVQCALDQQGFVVLHLQEGVWYMIWIWSDIRLWGICPVWGVREKRMDFFEKWVAKTCNIIVGHSYVAMIFEVRDCMKG